MKRFAIVIMVTLLLSMASGNVASAADPKALEQVTQIVEKANREIQELIDRAIVDCEREIGRHLQDRRKLEMGKDVVKLEKKLSNLEEKLIKLDCSRHDYVDKVTHAQREITKVQEELSMLLEQQQQRELALQQEVEARQSEIISGNATRKQMERLAKLLAEVTDQKDKLDQDIGKLNHNLEKRMNKLITDLVDETNERAAKAKGEGKKLGFDVGCSLIPVELAGQTVMIDPLYVIAW